MNDGTMASSNGLASHDRGETLPRVMSPQSIRSTRTDGCLCDSHRAFLQGILHAKYVDRCSTMEILNTVTTAEQQKLVCVVALMELRSDHIPDESIGAGHECCRIRDCHGRIRAWLNKHPNAAELASQ